MKNKIVSGSGNGGKEGRFVKAKIFKIDEIKKMRSLLSKLESMYLKMHDMSDEELEELWPNISESGLQSDDKKKNAIKKIRKTDKEFLLSILMQGQHFVRLQEFAKSNGVDLKSQETQQMLQQQANEFSRGH